ncbi:siderophore biosynthesis protein [Planotetraspora sp. A-T 1434]|uniref:IucA/IucC family protein n=1 Tax=Planotetraspora sp. A-T 1434 TaxID=2979219 RepID=UPI0021BE31AE|nr:IucA/IucC family protein [Planotetraspora sp. A-T 1434]MCT9932544.1 siderophore biosynthesis protein [Planotetraspora sp. A-T 1434]
MTEQSAQERYLAVRVLNALLREDYAGISSRLTSDKDGVALILASGRRVRLCPGSPFQDFAVAAPDATKPGRAASADFGLEEVLRTLEAVADPADAEGVAAFTTECHETLAALDLHEHHREEVIARLLRQERIAPGLADEVGDRAGGSGRGLIFYETLAAGVDHPLYPTARCRLGVSADELLAHAPEFAPSFELAWAAVPRARVTPSPAEAGVDVGTEMNAGTEAGGRSDADAGANADAVAEVVAGVGVEAGAKAGAGASGQPSWWPRPGDVGLSHRLAGTHVLFPVHPLTVPRLADMPDVIVGRKPYLTVRPTLSMRTVEVEERTHLKLPLATSTLGLRNRRSIKPGTLRDGALAESLLREVLQREPRMRVALADEQSYGHAGHEYLGWLIRRLPEGEIVPVAALLAAWPEDAIRCSEQLTWRPEDWTLRPGAPRCQDSGPWPGSATPGRETRLVLHELADRFFGGDVKGLLRDYLATLFAWNVGLFVRYGIALEAHQQNLALVFGDGPMRLLVKDNDGLLASPDRLRGAGLGVPDFGDDRMLTDDPHAVADVFVTITLHLAAAAITFPALGDGLRDPTAADLLREELSAALDPFGDDPMARLLRARTLDADRLVGKSMVLAGTLVDKRRSGARDINKFYGTTGPNYLRPTPRA